LIGFRRTYRMRRIGEKRIRRGKEDMKRNGTHPGKPASELFGQVAVRKGFVRSEDVEGALARQREITAQGHPHKLIGMIMLEMGVLGTTELIEVLRDMNLPGVVARRAVLKSPS